MSLHEMWWSVQHSVLDTILVQYAVVIIITVAVSAVVVDSPNSGHVNKKPKDKMKEPNTICPIFPVSKVWKPL